jgi:uridine kinase
MALMYNGHGFRWGGGTLAVGVEVVVGVAGGSCAGKTHFCRALVSHLGEEFVAHLCHDSYYRDRSELTLRERAAFNYDHPQALETELLIQHLEELRKGHAVEVPGYDFTTHGRLPQGVWLAPKPILLLEGILILSDARLREMLDLAVYPEVAEEVCLGRRIQRDTRERGRTPEGVLAQYRSSVQPMYREFVAPSRAHAHIIIPYGEASSRAEEVVAAWLRASIREEAACRER